MRSRRSPLTFAPLLFFEKLNEQAEISSQRSKTRPAAVRRRKTGNFVPLRLEAKSAVVGSRRREYFCLKPKAKRSSNRTPLQAIAGGETVSSRSRQDWCLKVKFEVKHRRREIRRTWLLPVSFRQVRILLPSHSAHIPKMRSHFQSDRDTDRRKAYPV